jgi:RNA-directed DNA polymerase
MPNEKKPKTKCVEYLRHAEYYDMQSTFDELYARSQAGEIFENLMDVILSRENILLAIGTSNPIPGVLRREQTS